MSSSIFQNTSIVRGMLAAAFATLSFLTAGCSGADADQGNETMAPGDESSSPPEVESSKLDIACAPSDMMSNAYPCSGGSTPPITYYRVCYGSTCMMCPTTGGFCYPTK